MHISVQLSITTGRFIFIRAAVHQHLKLLEDMMNVLDLEAF